MVDPKSHTVRNGFIQLSSKIEEDTSKCEQQFSGGYVCKKCFNLVKRCVDLTNNLEEIENTIVRILSPTLGHGEAVTIGIKRSNPSLGASTPKRIRLDDKSESSSVMVSLYVGVYVCNRLATRVFIIMAATKISVEYHHRVA